ncbi:MAG: 1-acyl-sn-glycerol-3-phosphate acyltransferase [Oscillospiraceae bacterium]|nr:1-acyl-sn-glycerol-3-phosphate acyltransferase [Oscillospiraceae bacterium]
MQDKKVPVLYRIIRWLVWLFAPKFKNVGTENLPQEPCVIVGNHSQMYGPIEGELYTPGKHYIWCAGEMMHREEVPEYAFNDFWSGKPACTLWFFRLLSRLVAPLSELIFTSAHTVPVYHDQRLITTFKESMKLLSEGNSMVIFPECYDEHNNVVHEFQDKFVDLARFYYKKTGIALSFVPIYVAPYLKTVFYGAPVQFDPQAPIAAERKRICNYLMDAITEMAAAQPVHTVVPYPNLPKSRYPKNLPLEVYSNENTDL